jgi:hypothetical protein
MPPDTIIRLGGNFVDDFAKGNQMLNGKQGLTLMLDTIF